MNIRTWTLALALATPFSLACEDKVPPTEEVVEEEGAAEATPAQSDPDRTGLKAAERAAERIEERGEERNAVTDEAMKAGK